jgi:hypothetical protein
MSEVRTRIEQAIRNKTFLCNIYRIFRFLFFWCFFCFIKGVISFCIGPGLGTLECFLYVMCMYSYLQKFKYISNLFKYVYICCLVCIIIKSVAWFSFSLCVTHKEGLCPSSGGINRLMMMMIV